MQLDLDLIICFGTKQNGPGKEYYEFYTLDDNIPSSDLCKPARNKDKRNVWRKEVWEYEEEIMERVG